MIIYLLSAWFVFPLAARPFYVTGCHSVSLFIPLDESEAYVSDIVRGEVSLHLRNGNLCAFTCVCTSCQMGVYDSTAGGGSQALKNRHKPYKGPFRPQQCYSTNQPHLHCSSSSRTAQRHHLYSAFLLNTVRERNENQTPDNSFLFVYSICHVATHHWEAPSSFRKSGF